MQKDHKFWFWICPTLYTIEGLGVSGRNQEKYDLFAPRKKCWRCQVKDFVLLRHPTPNPFTPHRVDLDIIDGLLNIRLSITILDCPPFPEYDANKSLKNIIFFT